MLYLGEVSWSFRNRPAGGAIEVKVGKSGCVEPSVGSMGKASGQKPTAEGRSLAGVKLLDGLSEAALDTLESDCTWTRYQPGQEIISYQSSDESVFFFVNGRARVIIYSASGRMVAFRDIKPGDVFGELAAIDGKQRSASVEASESCLVARLSSKRFRQLLELESSVAASLTLHLVAQVRSLTSRIFEFSTLAVQNRIHAELLRLAREGEQKDGAICISGFATRAEMASRISTHREAVSRELSRLADVGVIRRQGASLFIDDIERLSRMVHDATGE